MIASDLINYMIPPLKLSDEIQKAILWMEELHSTELPVVEKGEFLGFINEDTILELNAALPRVADYDLQGVKCKVDQSQHYYDVIKACDNNGLSLVAVTDNVGTYLGVITLEDVIQAFAMTSSIKSHGGILVLSMKQIDYSLAEISRLIESDNGKILSSYLTDDPNDSSKVSLTIKINLEDLSRVQATLERFGYQIVAKFNNAPEAVDEQERMDILMKYLGI
ncbi:MULTISPECIES: cbs domain containing protein [unclassified Imperialibacter]|uniref:cbs domain containing protein n=1 Tax=unclassified Imperialibacter TaxID=2629706 RepID=UPI0012596BBA|nr:MULTISPECIES: cbs domain containing protein [unclassified Imperialibacter]CAD5289307.1 Cbs domain containing protein [Imperialibacter sp. 89]CAD5289536.1 Cbs domain containing protein [Imperialibacter sp. 75]VVT34598.1 Cbs domain containing protein [Imperialibacter sp. EC-SDR9]